LKALIIDEHVKQAISQVVQYAEEHPVTIDEVLDMYNGQEVPVGESEQHVCFIPMDYRAVFSIEDQAKFHVRHLSISVSTPGKLPSPEAVMMLLPLFGFKNSLQDCMVRLEDFAEGHQAINVWEKI
jgi:hypothetical protein